MISFMSTFKKTLPFERGLKSEKNRGARHRRRAAELGLREQNGFAWPMTGKRLLRVLQ
jgi:hypothetical protein